MSLSWWNGRLVPGAGVSIAPDDAGFLLGDGLFETLRVDGGRARDVEAHLDRLLAGLRRIALRLPEDREALAEAVAAVAKAGPRPMARLRLTVTRGTAAGPTRLMTAAPYEPPAAAGVAVIVLSEPWIDSRSPLAGLKSVSHQASRLALGRAEAAGAWEALLLNERGRLVEGSRSNLVVALGGELLTPPLEDGCLPGTVRRRLLERGAAAERSLAPGDLERASGVFLTNSLIGVLPVIRIGGRAIPAGADAGRMRELLASP